MPASPFTLQDHKSLFRQLLAGFYDAIIITDPNGHVIETNPRAAEYFQYGEAEWADKPIGLFVPGVTPAVVQRIRRGLGEDRRIMLDANCVRKDGTSFPAEVTASNIDLLDPGDLVFTVRNVERRRRQTERFKTQENAFNVSQAALFACSPDGRVRAANPAFADMLGFDGEDAAMRSTFAELMPDDPLPALFARALEGEDCAVRVKADSDEGQEEIEIRLEPDMRGKKIAGVVGSVLRV